MSLPSINTDSNNVTLNFIGLAHFSMSVGSKEAVISLTETLRKDGYTIKGEPRTTGDGYFESVILDSDGNKVEITIQDCDTVSKLEVVFKTLDFCPTIAFGSA